MKMINDSETPRAVVEALKVELASYVKRFEASKPKGAQRREELVAMDPPSISIAALVALLQHSGPLRNLPDTTATSSALSPEIANVPMGAVKYGAIFDPAISNLGFAVTLVKNALAIFSFTVLPSNQIGPGKYTLSAGGSTTIIRTLHEITSVNDAPVAGTSGLAAFNAAVADSSMATALEITVPNVAVLGVGRELTTKRPRVAKHGPKAPKVKNREQSSQGRAVDSRKQKETAARVAKAAAGKQPSTEPQTRARHTELSNLLAEINTEEWIAAAEARFPVTAETGFLK